MATPRIAKTEFQNRIRTIQDALRADGLDALMVYGDEYRKENLRYVCNFWPIFERGGCLIPRPRHAQSWPAPPRANATPAR